MGVPKFYRWISERYPLINQMISDLVLLPEFDNMYLDMNGIIHACTHPNSDLLAPPLSLKEMILGIFRYIDRMVTEIVKPKKILFMVKFNFSFYIKLLFYHCHLICNKGCRWCCTEGKVKPTKSKTL